MDFLLECIGFAPDADPDELVRLSLERGEATPLRGDPADHRRLDLGHGLELRVDRDPERDFWTLLPHYQVPHRLRVAVEHVRPVPDSPSDVLLTGWADPPAPADARSGERADASRGAYRLTTWLSDGWRLPRKLPRGRVIAISVAGFALDVTYVGPQDDVIPSLLERPHGAHVAPLGDLDDPGGCCEVSLRVMELRRLKNRLTGREVDLCVCDAPGRPLLLFLSPWQLEVDRIPRPRAGWRVEGTFLFTGHVSGGLEGPRRRAGRAFG